MLEFGESNIKEILNEDTKRIPDVKSYGDKGAEEAKAFWNDVFSSREEQGENAFNLENAFSEIFGRDENEFSFDFDVNDIQINNIISDFKSEVWQTLPGEEKYERIMGLINILADKLELKSKPQIILFEGAEDNCGAFNPRENVIKINRSLLADSKELLNTIAHEMRHAYQHMRAGIGETFMDLLYALNFENYISPIPLGEGKFLFFLDYEDQLVEAEARAFAKLFM